MDPTMGQAPIFANEQQPLSAPEASASVISMSGYLNQADMQADQAGGTEASGLAPAEPEVFAADVSTETVLAAVTGEEQPAVAETLPAPVTPPEPPKYPIGKIDFNKPFEVFKNDDYQEQLTDVSIIAVLSHGTHRVVIAGTNTNDDEHIVLQFDLEGDDINGDWVVENISTEPQTKFVRLFIDGDRHITVDETLYDTKGEGDRAHTYTDVLGVFPVVIPPRVVEAPVVEAVVETAELSDDEYSEEEEHDDAGQFEAAVVDATPPAPPAPPHPDAKWVNGRLIGPGQIVSAYRQKYGTRQVEVIKTRDHAYQALFVKAQDGTNPYWALNKNIR